MSETDRTQADQDGYCVFDSAIGPCGIAWSARGVTHVQLPEKDRDATQKHIAKRSQGTPLTPPPQVASAIAAMTRYLDGEAVDFSGVSVDLTAAGDFHQKLYTALRDVAWGKTTTYGALGKTIGVSDARDIGQAMGKNPVPVIIPCHRVLAAGNKIGGFSAPGGIMTKEKLLTLEGVQIGVSEEAPMFPGLFAPQQRRVAG